MAHVRGKSECKLSDGIITIWQQIQPTAALIPMLWYVISQTVFDLFLKKSNVYLRLAGHQVTCNFGLIELIGLFKISYLNLSVEILRQPITRPICGSSLFRCNMSLSALLGACIVIISKYAIMFIVSPKCANQSKLETYRRIKCFEASDLKLNLL